MAVETKPKVEEEVIFLPPLEPMVIDETSKEILKRAYQTLKRPWGWTKGRYHTYTHTNKGKIDTFCTIGAINYAAGADAINGNRSAMKAAKYFALVIGKKDYSDIPVWNDEKGRKKAHILRVFEELLKD